MTMPYRALLSLLLATPLAAQVNPSLYAGLRWRNVGPFRAGRVSAVSGAIGQPGVFYIGLPAGGVWKTEDAGTVWSPMFDDVPNVSSVGAVEVAPSDPNIIYVGTGDLVHGGATDSSSSINEGDGMYKSTDAGRTWQHIGLTTTRQIPRILVDPHNPNIVLVAAQGNIHERSHDRGIYRSTDGGQNWTQVLFVSDEAGVQDIAWAYDHPGTIFATTVRHFNQPGEAAPAGGGRGRGAAAVDGDTSIYKSTDEGVSWTKVNGTGLPELSGRTGVAVAANTDARRVFLIGGFGLYRSDDGGATWAHSTTDTRITGSAYICDVYVDPKNPDVVYTMGATMYRSTDGGHNFDALMGAPGGDDQHVLWIDPTDAKRMLMGSDQGATVSFDWGATWSSWYNQPTGQFYHIGVGNGFPYWIYGIMQDSCGIATATRGDLGQITSLDWFPIPAWEYGSIAPDPSDPKILWTNGQMGLVKITTTTWHWQNISPIIGKNDYRRVTNPVLTFSPQDPKTLYFATQYLTATRDGGAHWQNLSPDLTIRGGGAATAAGGRGGPALESLAPSRLQTGLIWTGSNNGVLQVTQDGGAHWRDVSPPGLPTYADFSTVEASHFDAKEAYAVVDEHGEGDYRPLVYRTRDSGASWQPIISGLPTGEINGSFVRVVREDPERRGLLYAGTETSVYVSFDDGDHWQSLRLNLPITSYRDLVVHGNDLVAGTFGRGFYVLDGIDALRQIAAANGATSARLFQPGTAIRAMRDVNVADEFTPEAPHALNPPEGAIIDYYLPTAPASDIKLEILDAGGKVIRTYNSAPIVPFDEPPPPVPDYWLRKPQPMPRTAGGHRVNWDLKYDPPPALVHGYAPTAGGASGLAAVFHDTPATPEGPLVLPGRYTARLTVDGQTLTQPITVVNDPREGESTAVIAAMKAQLSLELEIDDAMAASYAAYRQAEALRARLTGLGASSTPEMQSAASAALAKLNSLAGAPARGRGGAGGAGATAGPTFSSLNASFFTLLYTVGAQDDAAPTEPQTRAVGEACGDLRAALTGWGALQQQNVAAINTMLSAAHQEALPVAAVPTAPACGAR